MVSSKKSDRLPNGGGGWSTPRRDYGWKCLFMSVDVCERFGVFVSFCYALSCFATIDKLLKTTVMFFFVIFCFLCFMTCTMKFWIKYVDLFF